MKVVRGYKTEMDLNQAQITLCRQHAGANRWAYNWGLQRKQEAYRATGKSPSAIDLHRELNALKKTAVPWMYEVSKCAPQEALRDLDRAFKHFFRRVQLKKQGLLKGKVGYPKPKCKKQGLGHFRLTGSIQVYPDAIQLPRLGRLRLHEHGYLPIGAKVLAATVSEHAGRWYVSMQVQMEVTDPTPALGAPIGVDLGIKTLATISDGRAIANPKALRTRLKQLRRANRRLHRRKKGGQNRMKARRNV